MRPLSEIGNHDLQAHLKEKCSCTEGIALSNEIICNKFRQQFYKLNDHQRERVTAILKMSLIRMIRLLHTNLETKFQNAEVLILPASGPSNKKSLISIPRTFFSC